MIFEFIPQHTLLQPQLRNFKQNLCTQPHEKAIVAVNLSSSDVAGYAFFQVLILCCFQTEPFWIVVKYHIVEITAVDVKLAGW